MIWNFRKLHQSWKWEFCSIYSIFQCWCGIYFNLKCGVSSLTIFREYVPLNDMHVLKYRLIIVNRVVQGVQSLRVLDRPAESSLTLISWKWLFQGAWDVNRRGKIIVVRCIMARVSAMACDANALENLLTTQKWLKLQIVLDRGNRVKAVMWLVACWEQTHRLKLEKLRKLVCGNIFIMFFDCSCFARSVSIARSWWIDTVRNRCRLAVPFLGS